MSSNNGANRRGPGGEEINVGNQRDDVISQVLNRSRMHAQDSHGFKRIQGRADGLLGLNRPGEKWTFDTSFVHGEGRVLITCTWDEGTVTHTITVRGTQGVMTEAHEVETQIDRRLSRSFVGKATSGLRKASNGAHA